MTPLMKRVVWGVGALSVLVYAIEGGEYGTSDLLTQRVRKAALAQNVELLAEDVDSLRAFGQRSLYRHPLGNAYRFGGVPARVMA